MELPRVPQIIGAVRLAAGGHRAERARPRIAVVKHRWVARACVAASVATGPTSQ